MSTSAVVLVTGASRGIGAATATALARAGADLVLAARSAEGLIATADEAATSGADVLRVATDLSAPDAAEELVDEALSRFGRLDAVVNNAATLEPITPLAEVTRGQLEPALAVNLVSPLLLLQAAIPALRARHGRVLNVSSSAASLPIAGLGTYGLTKAALAAATRVFSLEEPGITWLLVQPGPVDTGMHDALRAEGTAIEPARRRYYRQLRDQGQLAPPASAGGRFAWLALHAPATWSGREIAPDDADVNATIEERSSPS